MKKVDILQISYPILTLVIGIIAISSILITHDHYEEKYLKAVESYKIYNGINSESQWGVNGVYFVNSDYYCVNTKDRNTEEIMQTDYHEMCHNLVAKQYEHFCEDVS